LQELAFLPDLFFTCESGNLPGSSDLGRITIDRN
jgi:hypothetical protein